MSLEHLMVLESKEVLNNKGMSNGHRRKLKRSSYGQTGTI